MIAKILIGFGVLGFLIGVFGTVYGTYSSFAAMETAETNGISRVAAGIENAMLSVALSVGSIVVLIIGSVLFSGQKRFNSPR